MNNLAKNNSQNSTLEVVETTTPSVATVENYQIINTTAIDNITDPTTQSVVDGLIEANDIDNLIETGNETINEAMLPTSAENDLLDQSPRKPYIHSQPANWYQQNSFFKRYMLRELTAVPVALEALNLFWGLYSLASSIQHWQLWVAVQANFLMGIFHLLVIIAALYNSHTWFAAMPKAIRIQTGEKFVSDKVLISGSWLIFIIVLIALVAIVKYFS